MSFRIRLIVPILLILIAVFLRFYQLEQFATFLGDQGRDAIVMKRITTLEHFPAIGAPSSLGQIYLGPFFYYLVAPFLLLLNFGPLGPVLGVALLSFIGILTSTFIVKKQTNYETALFFFIFVAFSSVSIQFSRFSWNPNLLPIFSFLTIYFFYKFLTQKNKIYAVLFGSFLSFSIQLHHLTLLLLIPFLIISVYYLLKEKRGVLTSRFPNILISALSFIFFSIPLFIFDLRHDFLNTRNLIKLLTEGNATDYEGFLGKLLQTTQSFINHVFQFNSNLFVTFAISLLFTVAIVNILKSKKNLFLNINFIVFISYLLTFTFLNTTYNAHYYASIYLSFFLVLAWLITSFTKSKVVYAATSIAILAVYLFFNGRSLEYLFSRDEGNQIKKAETIANSLIRENPQSPFQTIALPNVETDGHIRYFLEIKQKRPLPADTLIEPKELYVLCFDKKCNVLGNPQWQIAAFKRAKIDKIWTVEGVTIYKVVHEQ